MNPTWFSELSSIDVSSHVRQKNGLNYLSWMWAWSELKKRYPLSYATVYETCDGMLVWQDPIGCHVKTSVTIVWEENGELHEHTATEYLPVMNFKNQSVPYESADSMLINKTIQRSLTKCIARLGLGGYLYANEDLPEDMTKLIALKESVGNIARKKAKLSDEAKAKVAELCKAAEQAANPDTPKDAITGDWNNIEAIDILSDLERKLLAIRK